MKKKKRFYFLKWKIDEDDTIYNACAAFKAKGSWGRVDKLPKFNYVYFYGEEDLTIHKNRTHSFQIDPFDFLEEVSSLEEGLSKVKQEAIFDNL